MIKIENIDVYGWEAAIRGMRNPMNSWDKSDSFVCKGGECFDDCFTKYASPSVRCPRNGDFSQNVYCVGENDLALMKKLSAAGTDHAKFLRMINVTMDITAPLYWWKEFDTYKVGTVANSCSTMHKIQDKKFTIDDFSYEKLIDEPFPITDEYVETYFDCLVDIIKALNCARRMFIETKDKKYWWQMIQLLPSSYNQKRTVQLNYAVLKNMYFARRNHKLDEWHTFCDTVLSLPYFEAICVDTEEAKE